MAHNRHHTVSVNISYQTAPNSRHIQLASASAITISPCAKFEDPFVEAPSFTPSGPKYFESLQNLKP